MIKRPMYSLEYGPDRELAERGIYKTGGGYDSSGINPGGTFYTPKPPLGVKTGGGLNPLTNTVPTANTGGGLTPSTSTVPTANTGGGLSPTPVRVPTATTGGGLPPLGSLLVNTGGTLPPTPVTVPTGAKTGGTLPPTPVPTTTPTGTAPTLNLNSQTGVPTAMGATSVADLISQMWSQLGGGTYTPGERQDPAEMANQFMQTIVGSNSPYIQQARRSALAQANSRGMLNSSIAAGNAEGAAIDRALPMFQQAFGLQGQREAQDFEGGQNDLNRALERLGLGTQLFGQERQNQFTAGQNALDRLLQKYGVDTESYNQAQQRILQKYGIDTDLLNNRENRQFTGEQNALDRTLKQKLQSDATFQQDWLNSQSFTRQFNAALAMIPINSADQLTQMLAQYGAENPEVYTPEVMSGMINFLSKNLAAVIDQYFDLGA